MSLTSNALSFSQEIQKIVHILLSNNKNILPFQCLFPTRVKPLHPT